MGGLVDTGFHFVLINLYFNYPPRMLFLQDRILFLKKEKLNVRRLTWKSNILFINVWETVILWRFIQTRSSKLLHMLITYTRLIRLALRKPITFDETIFINEVSIH